MLPNPLKRVAMLFGALSLLVVAGPVSSASAEVESSQITSPAGPAYVLDDETLPPSQTIFTVEGTTNISGKISIRCYFGTGKPSESYSTLAEEVTPSSEKFLVVVKPESLPGALHIGPCVLRAVPFGNAEPHPPGTPAEEAEDPYKGPPIAASRFELFPSVSNHYEYEIEANSLSGYFDMESVGDCGLDYSYLYAPEKLTTSEPLFDCNAALYSRDDPPTGSSSRSELQIDGANAYSPDAAHNVENELKVKALLPGAPQVTVTKTFEPSTGLVTVNEIDPIVKCFPQTVYPPTSTSCTSFVSTGVQLERTWQTSNADRVASMTDTWKSTDGAAHSLNALYDQATVNGGKEGGAYQFPGTNVFSTTTTGETVTLPPGLGRIYYKEDSETPSEGDGQHPQGAIVYDTPTSGPLSVYRGTAANEYNGFEMPYQATIPAGGSYTLRMAFIQAYKLSEVESLASTVLAGYPASEPPALSITSPANGTTVSSPTVTVSGTVADKRVITSFTVDGKAVGVGTNGAWSTSVALNKGANTIKALATDQAGFSTEKSVSVTYTTPPPPSVAHAKQVGSASGANGQVRFMILCSGPAGTSCEIEATLTTVEKTHNGRLIAVSARRHHHGTRSTRATVGSTKLTIPAGQRVTIEIPLNATGQSLLAQFGKLPVHLTVAQTSAGHRSTVIAQNLTITPHRKPRKHHHHHHHHHH